MWSLTLRDLQYRRRRFVIAVAGTSLVFAMALVMSGMSAGFRVEADRTLAAIGADAWVVPDGVAGPFTAFGTLPPSLLAEVGAMPGVRRADPIVVLRHTIETDGRHEDVNVIGHRVGGLGEPALAEGRPARRSGEAVVDRAAGIPLGGTIVVQGRAFRVVGLTEGLTYLAGIPVVAIPVEDAQALAFAGEPFATSIVTEGVPARAPEGLQVMTNAQAHDDLLRPLANGIGAIDNVRLLLWLVAATIIAAIVYLSALERVRDFAVLKAVGASTASLFGSLLAQAVLVALVSAAIAAGIGSLLAPSFPLPVEIPASAFAILPVAALVVGALASVSGLGRAMRADPARAFGGP